MAAHQAVITSLRIKVKGHPTRSRLVEGGILPAGTVGYLSDSGETTPWDTERLYNFYPNMFDETRAAAAGAAPWPIFVVLADDVVVRPDSRPETRAAVSVSVAEAGFTRIRHVDVDSSLLPLDRCSLVGNDTGGFRLVPLDDKKTNHFFVGRLLHMVPSESPLLYSGASSTFDIEIFRQRPILTDAVATKIGPRVASAGDLGGDSDGGMFRHPDASSEEEM